MEEEKKQLGGDQINNLLHGVKLIHMIEHLVEEFGWERLGDEVDIRCFNVNPTVKSSLKFLRKNPWARDEVEALYLKSVK